MQGASRGCVLGGTRQLCPSSLGVGPGDWDSCYAGRDSESPPPAARHSSAHLDSCGGRPVRSEQGCTSCTGLWML